SFFAFAFDFVLYNFGYYLSVIFSTLFGYQPLLLLDISSNRAGIITGMVITLIKKARISSIVLHPLRQIYHNSVISLYTSVLAWLFRRIPIDQVRARYERLAFQALRFAR
ncbi:hypothetical protein PMAYCL1PPCAC_10544, partial [Pristionchus mayeri]